MLHLQLDDGSRVKMPRLVLHYLRTLQTMVEDLGQAGAELVIPLGNVSRAQLLWLTEYYNAVYTKQEDQVADVGELERQPMLDLVRFYGFVNFIDAPEALEVVLTVLARRLQDRADPLPVARLIALEDVEAWHEPGHFGMPPPLSSGRRARIEYALAALPYARRYRRVLSFLREHAAALPEELLRPLLRRLPAPTLLPVVCGPRHIFVCTPAGLFVAGGDWSSNTGVPHQTGERHSTNGYEAVDHVGDVIALATNANSSYLLTTRGLYAAGGDLDPGYDGLFHPVAGLEGQPLAIACGDKCVWLITTQGLFAHGENGDGRLGLGHRDQVARRTFVRVSGISGTPLWVVSTQRSPSLLRTFLMTSDGLYCCWPAGGFALPRFARVEGLAIHSQVSSLACYAIGAMLIADGGDPMQCANYASLRPTPVFNTMAWVAPHGAPLQIACGYNQSLVATEDGQLWGLGSNGAGQLGLGKVLGAKQWTRVPLHWDFAPEPVPLLALACGEDFSAVLTPYGLYLCGNNNFGTLGYQPADGVGYRSELELAAVPGLPLVTGAGDEAVWEEVEDAELVDNMRAALALYKPTTRLFRALLRGGRRDWSLDYDRDTRKAIQNWDKWETQAVRNALLAEGETDVNNNAWLLATQMRLFLVRIAVLKRLVHAYEQHGQLAVHERRQALRLLEDRRSPATALDFKCRLCSEAPTVSEVARPALRFCTPLCQRRYHYFARATDESK